ncbi:MAG TPA: kelch repeat-containing protein [Cytophaga sp.]|jgi:N-acetylneuraminic acid mutarotase|nr:kelch repeat-containing protein [Cytophaga sp.]
MKKKNLLLLSLLITAFLSCKKSDDTAALTGDWVTSAYFEGVARSSSVGFTIDGKVYVGTGYDGSKRLTDFWVYEPATNFWQQKADFPGAARSEAVGFATTTNGYIGTGYDGTTSYKDFYEYDPSTNTWLQKADFGGTARYSAVAFQVYENGFVGTGYDGNYKKDFWQYDPLGDTWTVIPSIGGEKRMDAVAMAINQKAYVLSGSNNGLYVNDVWEYNFTTGLWTQKTDLAADLNGDGTTDRDLKRSNASSFVINNKGYLVGGYNNGYIESCWEYEPTGDTWTQRVDFEGTARMDAVGVNINNRGFVLTGRNGNSRYDDFWEFVE